MSPPRIVIRLVLLGTLILPATRAQVEAKAEPDNPATRLQRAVVETLKTLGVQDKIHVGAIVRPPDGSTSRRATIPIQFLHKEGYAPGDLLRLLRALDDLNPLASLSAIDLGLRDPGPEEDARWRPLSAALSLHPPDAARHDSMLEHLRRLLALPEREDLRERQDAEGDQLPQRLTLHRLSLEASLMEMLPGTALLVIGTDSSIDAAQARQIIEDLPACRVAQVLHSVTRGSWTWRSYRLFLDDEHTPPDAARFDAIIGRVLGAAGIAGLVSVVPQAPAKDDAGVQGLRELRFTQSWRLGDLRRVLGAIENTHPSIRIRELEVAGLDHPFPEASPQWRSVRAVIEVAAATSEKDADGGSILAPLGPFLACFAKLNRDAEVATLTRLRVDREGINWDMALRAAKDPNPLAEVEAAFKDFPGKRELDMGTPEKEGTRILQRGCRLVLKDREK